MEKHTNSSGTIPSLSLGDVISFKRIDEQTQKEYYKTLLVTNVDDEKITGFYGTELLNLNKATEAKYLFTSIFNANHKKGTFILNKEIDIFPSQLILKIGRLSPNMLEYLKIKLNKLKKESIQAKDIIKIKEEYMIINSIKPSNIQGNVILEGIRLIPKESDKSFIVNSIPYQLDINVICEEPLTNITRIDTVRSRDYEIMLSRYNLLQDTQKEEAVRGDLIEYNKSLYYVIREDQNGFSSYDCIKLQQSDDEFAPIRIAGNKYIITNNKKHIHIKKDALYKIVNKASSKERTLIHDYLVNKANIRKTKELKNENYRHNKKNI